VTVAEALQTAAVPLLIELEAAGFELAVDGDRLRVKPVDRLTAEQRAALAANRDAAIALVRYCDELAR
jgi:hypothetical protein